MAMNVPDDRRYTSDHEWASSEDGRLRVGITEYAQDALGDVVYVQIPEEGRAVDAGAVVSEVESTKAVSEIYAPVAGEVVEVNQALADSPELLNSDPYSQGWIFVLQPSDPGAYEGLLDPQAYRDHIAD